jgi:hypothetical protein
MIFLLEIGKIIKQQYSNILLKHSSFFIFIISYYIFYLSLEPCLLGEDPCGNNLKWIYKKFVELVISCELVVYLIYKIIFMNLSKLHLIHLLMVFVLFYIHSNNFFFHDHGMYNFIFFFFLLLINILLILLLKSIIYIVKIKEKINNFLKISYICILIVIYYYKFPNFDCGNEWVKGLNNTSIENDERKYGCQIKIPKYCQYKLLSPFFDFTKIFHINCSHKKFNSRKIILKYSKSPYINKKTKKFGFPYTNYGFAGCADGVDTKIIKGYIQRNIFDVENNYKNFSEPEIIVDFSKDQFGEFSIDVKYNESLSKERKDMESKNSPYSNNIIIIYMDSVSRAHSMRQLNKTLSFFESFMSYEGGFNQKFPEEKFHSFQFFKYHSFLERTAGNLPPMYYGNIKEAKNIVRINKYFKENGYITSYSCDLCQKDNTRTFHNISSQELYDHQLLLCDPNVVRYYKPTVKCLYGKIDISYLFDYTEQFWRKYKNNRKFSTILLNSSHESSAEVLKYLDYIIFSFLNSLYNDNLFKDTSIFLLSDHGIGIQSIYYIMDFFKYEYLLPMLYIIINDRKNTSYNEQYYFIHQNQQTFITAYDIYNTINNLLYGDNYANISNLTDENATPKSSLGKSLLEKIDAKYRNPKNYDNMDKHVCV